jgi:hypothetical protein
MGIIGSKLEVDKIWNTYTDNPVIWCMKTEEAIEIFNGYYYISLGEKLSEKLCMYDSSERNLMVLKELDNLLLTNNYDKILIDKIDILFNPSYKLNVLMYLSKLARVKKVVVIWSGRCIEDSLIYSKPEYEDYTKYIIKDYDILCIK